jgi:hypothetical protein
MNINTHRSTESINEKKGLKGLINSMRNLFKTPAPNTLTSEEITERIRQGASEKHLEPDSFSRQMAYIRRSSKKVIMQLEH